MARIGQLLLTATDIEVIKYELKCNSLYHQELFTCIFSSKYLDKVKNAGNCRISYHHKRAAKIHNRHKKIAWISYRHKIFAIDLKVAINHKNLIIAIWNRKNLIIATVESQGKQWNSYTYVIYILSPCCNRRYHDVAR